MAKYTGDEPPVKTGKPVDPFLANMQKKPKKAGPIDYSPTVDNVNYDPNYKEKKPAPFVSAQRIKQLHDVYEGDKDEMAAVELQNKHKQEASFNSMTKEESDKRAVYADKILNTDVGWLAKPLKLLSDPGSWGNYSLEEKIRINQNIYDPNRSWKEKLWDHTKMGLGMVPAATVNVGAGILGAPQGAGLTRTAISVANDMFNPYEAQKGLIKGVIRGGVRLALRKVPQLVNSKNFGKLFNSSAIKSTSLKNLAESPEMLLKQGKGYIRGTLENEAIDWTANAVTMRRGGIFYK